MKAFKNYALIIKDTLSIWVSILAILTILIAIGYLNVSSGVDVLILQPVIVVEKEDVVHFAKKYKDAGLDSLINYLFKDSDVIVFSEPNMRSDTTIYDYFFRNMKTTKFIRGDSIARAIHMGQNGKDDIFIDANFVEVLDSEKDSDLKDMTIQMKRASIWLGLDQILRDKYGSSYISITSDSLLELQKTFSSIIKFPTLMIYNPIYYARYVYSILSIENNSSNDINDIRIKICQKKPGERVFNYKLDGWTYGNYDFYYSGDDTKELAIDIPKLKNKTSIQVLISSWQKRIKQEDIYLTYNQLKSINKRLCLSIILISLIFALIVSVLINYQVEP